MGPFEFYKRFNYSVSKKKGSMSLRSAIIRKSKSLIATEYEPFSKLSICSLVNDVRLRWSFLLRRSRIWGSSSPDELCKSELPSEMLPSLQSVSSIKMNQDIESSDRLPSVGTIRHNTRQIKTNRKVSRLSTNRSTSVDSIQESRSRRVNGDSIKTDSNHQSTRCYTDRQKEGDWG